MWVPSGKARGYTAVGEENLGPWRLERVGPAEAIHDRDQVVEILGVRIGQGVSICFAKKLYPDGRTPVLSPAYDFVATLPYIPGDQLALTFGGSRSLSEVTAEQVRRRFADTVCLPVSPVWRIVTETMEQTVSAWKTLEQKDLLTADIRNVIDHQIHTVVTNTGKGR